MTEEQRITCLVTIHGMGFQIAPDPKRGISHGYADPLHKRLSRCLTWPVLSDDPHRERHRRNHGEAGAIYVHSHWPVATYNVEEGLKRLGKWRSAQRDGEGAVYGSGEDAQLTEPGGKIAHVALIYAHPQNRPLQNVGSLAAIAFRALLFQRRYGDPFSIGWMLVRSLLAMSIQTRAECPDPQGLRLRRQTDLEGPPGMWGVIRAVAEDVATYVARNDLREEVRGFVREALLRLAGRSDVESIVVNAHSQGTVAAFDAVRSLPPLVASKVRWLITSGSPLRKYAELFHWGTDVGSISRLDRRWWNFWDPHDIVADPLAPSGWQVGDDEAAPSLFRCLDPETAEVRAFPTVDRKVNNLTKSCGAGLRAHNYWDNDEEFVGPLSEILRHTLDQRPQPRPPQTETVSLLAS